MTTKQNNVQQWCNDFTAIYYSDHMISSHYLKSIQAWDLVYTTEQVLEMSIILGPKYILLHLYLSMLIIKRDDIQITVGRIVYMKAIPKRLQSMY